MSETPGTHEPIDAADPAGAEHRAGLVPVRPARRKRRARRIVLVSLTSVLTVVGAVLLGGLLAVNHLENNVHRIPNAFAGLDAANQPVMPPATKGSMTILLTGSKTAPAHRGGSGIDGASTGPEYDSGLIALVHINANGRAAAIVEIPPNTLVQVPGHGRMEIDRALGIDGPALLIRTVEQLTDVRIDHYSVVDFNGLTSTLGPLHGVSVDIPDRSTVNGVKFHAGMNHLNSSKALDYVRDAALTEDQRVLRQESLLRAILDKIAQEHLLNSPESGFKILNAFTKALSVDSNFTNSDLRSLALHLHLLGAGSGTFVTAPIQRTRTFHGRSAVTLNPVVSGQLWQAIRNDAVAAFAKKFPETVTPGAPK